MSVYFIRIIGACADCRRIFTCRCVYYAAVNNDCTAVAATATTDTCSVIRTACCRNRPAVDGNFTAVAAVTAADTRALGIEVGDIVAFEPRTRVTESGYIKSRFLDDKLSVAILLGLAKYIKDENITLPRHTYVHVTVYEEVGHGCSASCPADVTEGISVDMGCVGNGLSCTERTVSICPKDSHGPYSYEVVGKLIDAAKAEGADYAVDIYPFYGSDVEATLTAGADIRHGLIGPGVYASHGYERSHIDGVWNTLKVLKGYLHI